MPLHNSPGGHSRWSLQASGSPGVPPQSPPPSAALHFDCNNLWVGVTQLVLTPSRLHRSHSRSADRIPTRAARASIRLNPASTYRRVPEADLVMSRIPRLVALGPESIVRALMAQQREQSLARSVSEPTPLVSSPSDAELAERLSRNDPWAKEALYRKYVQTIWGLALRLTGNRADAEDVLQDTFAEALRDAGQLRERTALRAWLMSVAVHQAHRRFRRRRLLRAFGLDRSTDTALMEAVPAADASADVVAELTLLGRVLSSLPAKERIAWSLRFIEGCSLLEVAQLCDCSLATAKRRILAAQRRVARHVDVAPALGEDGDV
jgi:RNA polymerase sigma-70 factor, ECF subfamily